MAIESLHGKKFLYCNDGSGRNSVTGILCESNPVEGRFECHVIEFAAILLE